jgi:hypothetical protein
MAPVCELTQLATSAQYPRSVATSRTPTPPPTARHACREVGARIIACCHLPSARAASNGHGDCPRRSAAMMDTRVTTATLTSSTLQRCERPMLLVRCSKRRRSTSRPLPPCTMACRRGTSPLSFSHAYPSIWWSRVPTTSAGAIGAPPKRSSDRSQPWAWFHRGGNPSKPHDTLIALSPFRKPYPPASSSTT